MRIPRQDLSGIKRVRINEKTYLRLWLAKVRYGCRSYGILIDRALDALEDRYPPR